MKKAFTLIELLVVVLIIGILAAIALPQYNAATAKSRLAQEILMTRALTDAQERYRLATEKYAADAEELDISIPADFTACAANSSRTVYFNGKTQIFVGNTVWGMGKITSACQQSVSKTAVMVYIPGVDVTCPSSEPRPCMYCFSGDSYGQQACAAMGTYVGNNGSGTKTYRIAS